MTGGASGHRSDAAWLVGLCLSRFLVALVFCPLDSLLGYGGTVELVARSTATAG